MKDIAPLSVPTGETDAARRVTRMEPSRGFRFKSIAELWMHRELLALLVWRDVKVRYKQTALGVLWAILQPLLTMVLFTLIFGRLGKIPSDGVPYALFSLTGLVPWTFFSNGFIQGSNSLVANTDLITKVYFPRLLIPLGSVLGGTIDLLMSFIVLLGVLLAYGRPPPLAGLLLPLFVLFLLVTSFGVSVGMAALNVRYRDIRYVLPFVVQLALLTTPIAYPSSVLRQPWRTVVGLNPVAGIVEGFRWALLGTPLSMSLLVASASSALLVLGLGVVYFQRVERGFADVA